MDLHWHKVGAELGMSPIEKKMKKRGNVVNAKKHLNGKVKSI